MEKMYEHLGHLFQREFDTNETLQVLRINIVVYWSWGVSRHGKIDDKALLLQVNGAKHGSGGYVCITLGWDDTYSVTLLDKMLQIVGNTHTGVYVDMLQDYVDKLIETR